MEVTQEALDELRRIVSVRAMGYQQILRLAMPPVWTGGGDFGIVVDQISDEDIANVDQDGQWLAYGRGHDETRYAPLTDINNGNVQQLGVEWFIDLPNDVGLVSTPLVIDGILYFIGTMNIVRAVDAASGEIIWTYDPLVAEEVGNKKKVGWVHNRGLSFYGNKVLNRRLKNRRSKNRGLKNFRLKDRRLKDRRLKNRRLLL